MDKNERSRRGKLEERGKWILKWKIFRELSVGPFLLPSLGSNFCKPQFFPFAKSTIIPPIAILNTERFRWQCN